MPAARLIVCTLLAAALSMPASAACASPAETGPAEDWRGPTGAEMAGLPSDDEANGSTIVLSELGSPGTDRDRTGQYYQFDNLDFTGFYVPAGEKVSFTVRLEADDPSAVRVVWRQAGQTDTNSYTSLNYMEKKGLSNGENRIEIDASGKKYGYMVYLANDSRDNPAKARIEQSGSGGSESPAADGARLGRHPLYVHDTAHPERFWEFVQELRRYVAALGEGAADMAGLQLGDDGRAQFSLRASALAACVSGIASEGDAAAWVERASAAAQDRLEFFWAFDGFDEAAPDDANAASRMRVHTAFTNTVTSPSTMYAWYSYFHMPESSAKGFFEGDLESVYGWGMSHEYGHILDHKSIAVLEETNNLYSMAASRHKGILRSQNGGSGLSTKDYHRSAAAVTERLQNWSKQRAQNPAFVPDWSEGGQGGWTRLVVWWNCLQFFNGWDWAGYDFGASPYTVERARDVEDLGAHGAMMRILRGDSDARREIERLSSTASGASVQYNRIATALTMATGYDCAAYLERMGERDLVQPVKEYCAQYPQAPVKLEYYTIDADAAEENGARPFSKDATVDFSALDTGKSYLFNTKISDRGQDDVFAAGYELYCKGELVAFSAHGSFSRPKRDDVALEDYAVIAYDARLNPSKPTSVTEPLFTATASAVRLGQTGTIDIVGPPGASYRYAVADEGVLSVDAKGAVTPHKVGTTTVSVTMKRPDDAAWRGPVDVDVTVSPAELTLKVADAEMTAGAALPAPEVSIVDGALLDGDELGEISYLAVDRDGTPVDTRVPGTCLITASATALDGRYDVVVIPGTLTVHPAPAAGGNGGTVTPAEPSYDVTVDQVENGSVSVSPEKAKEGDEVTITVKPDAGFELESLAVADEDGNELEPTANAAGTYSFEMPAGDVTVTASFACDGGALCPSHGFTDVDQSQWYHAAVDWAVEAGVLHGIGGTALMMPDGEITRAQMATVLFNVEGADVGSAQAMEDYADADPNAWYAGSLAWAVDQGLFYGWDADGASYIDPDGALTREQAAAVLMRWTAMNGDDVSGRADLSAFPDTDRVSGWATECMQWAVAEGVLQGVEQDGGERALAAQGSATRAQTATLMMRLTAGG